nr:UDP-N-acetylmuramate dehydrogenase [Lachnospiraceae bacterium]
MAELKTRLEEMIGRNNCLADEEMKKHTTFRVGGPADIYVTPNIAQLPQVIRVCMEENVPYYIVGNGSNLLVSDSGYRGVIIELKKNASKIFIRKPDEPMEDDASIIEADAGALLSTVATSALNVALKGFEFAAGIPGTVGGAVSMNAGAYGGEIKDVLIDAKVYDIEADEIKTLSNEELKLGYRRSVISDGGYVVLSARIKLSKGEHDSILAYMNELKEKRVSKQPLDMPSAGSTFKRPEGYFAGKLIEDAGLKGFAVGGAMVSQKHAGFVVNAKDATASDIYTLIKAIQKIVKDRFDVELEPEVKMI